MTYFDEYHRLLRQMAAQIYTLWECGSQKRGNKL